MTTYNGYHVRKAKCIKDGFMNNSKQFCIKNKIYKFVWIPLIKKYHVNSEGRTNSGFSHTMSKSFFQKFFYEEEDFITEKEMVIW